MTDTKETIYRRSVKEQTAAGRERRRMAAVREAGRICRSGYTLQYIQKQMRKDVGEVLELLFEAAKWGIISDKMLSETVNPKPPAPPEPPKKKRYSKYNPRPESEKKEVKPKRPVGRPRTKPRKPKQLNLDL
jgi:hypothetical protein